MVVKVEFEDDVLILTLGEKYTVTTIAEIMEVVDAEERLKGINHVIVDCGSLKELDNFGGEFFILKEKLNPENFLFSGLDEKLVPIVNVFSQDWFGEDITNLPTREEAMGLIKKL